MDDLATLGYERATASSSMPLPETMRIVGSQMYVLTYLHPAGLVGYIYVMESTPPSERSFRYLEQQGISRKAMSFLIRHGETDVRHRAELKQIVEGFFRAGPAEEALRVSALMGLSDLNRLLSRLKSGRFIEATPLPVFQQSVAH